MMSSRSPTNGLHDTSVSYIRSVYRLLIVSLLYLFALPKGTAIAQTRPAVTRVATTLSATDSIRMVLVRGGTFDMGSTRNASEQPVHSVTVGSFYMSIYEITQEQWEVVTGYNYSSYRNCRQCAMEGVSWNEVQLFLEELNRRTGKHHRLPTEAEWEYAARGGHYMSNYLYSGSNNILDVASRVSEGMPEAARRTQVVGQHRPNDLGIYDMNGNLQEWCSDWYDEHYYGKREANNPKGPTSGIARVYRGGFYASYPQFMTNTCRRQDPEHYAVPSSNWPTLGFRIVRDVD